MSALALQRLEGKYEILDKLREGGMGAIYKVRHRLLDEIRVIKLMRQQLVDDQDLKTRFLREARLAIKLRHPNVAHLYDFTVDEDGTAFIVMEFIDGMTLEDVLKLHGPPPLGLALEIAQQSLRALGYLHGKGFVHRDISPDNLMLTVDADGQPLVKLIDLGIAKILDARGESHLTQTGTFLGKIRYSAPEQFGTDGAAMVDSRGDLYSFGVVLYELLTGRYPIQGKDSSSIIAGHLFRPPLDFAESDPAARIPPQLREIVLRALAKQPDERFADAKELSRALGSLRAPADFADVDLQGILQRASGEAVANAPLPPGSTQEKLDQRFGLAATPSPGRILELVKTEPTRVEEPPVEAVRTVGGTIELQLERGDLAGAEGELRQALDRYGEQPELRTLRDHLQEQKLREARRQVEALIGQARDLRGAGDLEAAFDHLMKARDLAPGDPQIEDLLERTDQELRRREEEQVRAREISAAAGEVQAALARRDAQAAGELLREAEARWGRQEVLSNLAAAAEELRREQRKREVAALVNGAQRKAEAEDFQGALDELQRAQGIDPESAEARALLDRVETGLRRQDEERRRGARIAETAAGVEALLAAGDWDTAGEMLREARDELGQEPDLERLRSRVKEARRAAAALARQTVDSTLRLPPVAEPPESAAAPVDEPEPAPLPLAAPAPVSAPAPAPALPPASPLPQRTPEPERPEPSRAGRPGRRLAGALALLAVLAIGLMIWLRPEPPAPWQAPAPQPSQQPGVPTPVPVPVPSPVPSPAPVPTPEAVPVPLGTLVIDALPWAEVVRIEDAEGRAVDLGSNRYTPLALAVPEGRYQVVLKGPGPTGERRVAATVGRGSQPVFAVFRRTSAEEYFRDLGF